MPFAGRFRLGRGGGGSPVAQVSERKTVTYSSSNYDIGSDEHLEIYQNSVSIDMRIVITTE
jgi:hypothetical protein